LGANAPDAEPVVAANEAILFADEPAVSPDGKQVAFAWRGDVWTVPIAGGTAKRLTMHPADDSRPHWSPDGTTIAFDSNRAGSRQLFLLPATGGPARRVSGHSEGYTLQGWRPDGEALLAVGSRDHFWRNSNRFIEVTIPPAGVTPGTLEATPDRVLFDAYGTDGAWSPDGSKLLYVREGERWWRKGYRGPQAAQIWLWDAEADEHQELLMPPGGARSPQWNADGSGFYYAGRGVDENGLPASPAFDLRFYNFESEASEALTDYADDGVLHPAVGGEADVCVYRHLFGLMRLSLTEPAATPEEIPVAVSADDGPDPLTRRTASGASSGDVSPDALEWVFASGGDIWVMETELKEPVLVTRDETGEFGSPAWDTEPIFLGGSKTAGPEKILFLSETDGQVDLYSAERTDATAPWWRQESFKIARLTETPETERNLSLSPTGKQIAFVREPGELVISKPDGTEPKTISDGFDAPGYVWGPKGYWIAMSRQDEEFNSEIYILSADGTQPPVNVSRHPDND
ncbi:MAG: hypothetical protein AAF907_12420, partial [Planctomycetota bacterium]